MISQIKTALNPFDLTGAEVYYMHDPYRVMTYSNRVDIDMK